MSLDPFHLPLVQGAPEVHASQGLSHILPLFLQTPPSDWDGGTGKFERDLSSCLCL